MFRFLFNSMRTRKPLAVLLLLGAGPGLAAFRCARQQEKEEASRRRAPGAGPHKFAFDPTKLVWPAPPNIARVHWLDYFAGEKIDYTPAANAKPKASWMDRLAGGQSQAEKIQPQDLSLSADRSLRHRHRFQGAGLRGRSKGRRDLHLQHGNPRDALIRNGFEAHFGWINGLAIDDDDRLFVSDGKLHRVLIFNPKHEVNQITEGLVDPVGLAIDTDKPLPLRGRYPAGSGHRLRRRHPQAAAPHRNRRQEPLPHHPRRLWRATRRCGGQGRQRLRHRYPQQSRGDLRRRRKLHQPFGKNGDGPGYFARPKGIAVDGDGHIWVADQMQDRLQVFNREGSC